VHKASCRNWDVWLLNGRLGNRLVSLSAVLSQAVALNLCFAWVPPDDAVYLRQIINIPQDGIIDMAEPQGAPSLPVNGDNCVESHFDPFEIANSSQLLQDFFVSNGRLLCDGSDSDRPELGPQGVVFHMRSGDIMEPRSPPGYDPQPPCTFYVAVMEHGNNGTAFDHGLIVTQQDKRNPCIAWMLERYPSQITVQSRSVNQDACVLANAQNFATGAWSTWDTGLSRLNANLKNLYIPMGEDSNVHYYINAAWAQFPFTRLMVRDEGMPYVQHVYTFPNYTTYWASWDERVASMVSYPQELIIKRSIPAHRPNQGPQNETASRPREVQW
jgi:hypothetical protein